jgi:hypothetical protein
MSIKNLQKYIYRPRRRTQQEWVRILIKRWNVGKYKTINPNPNSQLHQCETVQNEERKHWMHKNPLNIDTTPWVMDRETPYGSKSTKKFKSSSNWIPMLQWAFSRLSKPIEALPLRHMYTDALFDKILRKLRRRWRNGQKRRPVLESSEMDR